MALSLELDKNRPLIQIQVCITGLLTPMPHKWYCDALLNLGVDVTAMPIGRWSMQWPVTASTAMVRGVGGILVGQRSIYPVILSYPDDNSS